MRLLILSDLHFEFHPDGGEEFMCQYRGFDGYDVAVLAGDLCDYDSLEESLQLMQETFGRIVYVLGNHECYGASVNEASSVVKANVGPQASFLIRGSTVVEGQRFVGDALWFPHDRQGRALERMMNDFRYIEGLSEEVDELHDAAKGWLYGALGLAGDDVLVTHHLPSHKSVHANYQGSDLNRFFVGDIEPLVADRQPKLAVHGHTHESCDYHIGRTRVVCNPFGYWGREENPAFDPFLVVEV